MNSTELAARLDRCAGVVTADLSGNRLGHGNVPYELVSPAMVRSLEILYLDRCLLEQIPDWISNLRYLKRISVSGNLLDNLPSTLGQCRFLESIRACGNQLEDFPAASLLRLQWLQDLDLSVNPPLHGWALTFIGKQEEIRAFLCERVVWENCRCATLFVLWWSKHEQMRTILGRDVGLIVAQYVWSTRYDPIWMPTNEPIRHMVVTKLPTKRASKCVIQ